MPAAGKKHTKDVCKLLCGDLARIVRYLGGCLEDAICMPAEWQSGQKPCQDKPPLQVCVLDAGCGEGMYLARVQAALRGSGKGCKAYGVDVSKIAIRMAAKRHKQASFAVASSYVLPFDDQARKQFPAVGSMHLFGN